MTARERGAEFGLRRFTASGVPKSLNGLPTIIADMECLRQQLRELHAAVKAQNAQHEEQCEQPAGVGMVIRGK